MGAFKLGKMTFGSLFKQPETVLYPLQKKPQPAGLKGHIVIDAQACILCGMCDRSCTTDCITVDKAARTWSTNRYQCIQCGYCITVCPKKCLSMHPDYAPAATAIAIDTVQVPEQPKPAKAASEPVAKAKDAEAQPRDAKADPAPGSGTDSQDASSGTADHQVEALLGLMDPEKAKAIAEALGR